ncbi:MAG: DUF2752 domain-containing protein [Turicibacter sp.]|nr:DUF2752 domain-containing protein [Turicibacter sp.]
MGYFRWIRFLLYVSGIIVIYLIPLDYIESQRFCIWYHLFHMDCLGCGFTRAFFCLMHGQVIKAFSYHPMILLVPVVGIILLQDCYLIIKKSHQLSFIERSIQWIMMWLYPSVKGMR